MRQFFSVTIVTTALIASTTAADWPHWRGPHGTGVADESSVPTRWSATENVVWKAPIGGLGVSTPIVSGDRIFVTSQIGASVRRPGKHPRIVQGSNAAEAVYRDRSHAFAVFRAANVGANAMNASAAYR